MKTFILFLVFSLPFSLSLFSQNAPSLAPLNPDFVRFMELQKSGKAPQPGMDGFGIGAMPPPGIVSFDNYLKSNKLKSANFAAKYDMRTTGLLTPVKGQTGGACWAFATMASVESRWLTLGLGTWDLSDNNLKYCHGFIPERNTWGNHWMSTAYFARRSGPLVEADDPNASSSECPIGKTPVGYITDARYLPHDMNTIKQAILDYGAIYTMMYISDAYYNSENYTYYYNGTPQVNHAVDLVGWDDTKVTAGGTGAWICKNSWGVGWGEAGYFYISYNDKSVLDYNAYWPTRIDNNANTEVYGYDYLGNFESFYYGVPQAYILVKFVASSKQILRKIGTYAMAANTDLGIDIFDNFDTLTKKLSGSLSSQTSLSCGMPGYYTFDLPAPVAMEQGNDFYIRIRYHTPDFNYPIPIEYFIDGYASPQIESYVAWISSNPDIYPWILIGGSTAEAKWDPCVKVYAEPYAETLTWNGSASTDWNTAGNWTPAIVPNASNDVIIPDVAQKPVVTQTMASPAVCKNLTIELNSSVTVNTVNALTVYGTLTNNAGNSGLNIESGASLITKGVVNGSATVKRDITASKWHFISSPVSNAKAGTFTGKYLQNHIESTNTYTDITSVAEPLIPLRGYTLWGNNSGFTAQYSGMLNTGNQSVSLTRSAAGLNSGWNLLGNPYPSSIDWYANGWTKTNVNNAIYIENADGWATYISGTGANGGSRYIAPGQGFFVNVAANGAGSITMNDFVRVHNATTFFKSAAPEPDSILRLQVSGNGYKDEAVVRFMSEATVEFDGEYDAFKLFGFTDEAAQIYTLGSVPLAINSLPHGIGKLPMGIHAHTSGNYSISATQTGKLGEVTIEDLKTGIFTNLSDNTYTFALTTGEDEQRFILHFNIVTTTNTDEPVTAPANIYSYNRTIHVNLQHQVKGDIFIYSIDGQLIDSKYSASGTPAISLSTPGIYIVKVITEGNTMVKKVWIY